LVPIQPRGSKPPIFAVHPLKGGVFYITLFRATDRQAGLGRTIDPQLGWGELALRGVDIIEVPGHHLSILTEPNVKILADQLRDRIDRSLES
jgi:thioesterase domain-containing protein